MNGQSWMPRVIFASMVTVILLAGALGRAGAQEREHHAVQPGQQGVVVFRAKQDDYYLGLVCFPVEGALRAQLNLAEGEGLLVDQIAPHSPAAKAGFKPFDVLLAAQGKKLHAVADLTRAVNDSKGKPLTIELIRGGKMQSVDATASPRAKDYELNVTGNKDYELNVTGNLDPGSRYWLRQHDIQPGGKGPLRLHFFNPGIIVGNTPPAKLPQGLRVSITRTGDEPAQVVVRRGDEKWEVTENQLDKLPQDIRPHVERMLGRMAHGVVKGGDFMLKLVPNSIEVKNAVGTPLAVQTGIERQLNQLHEQLEQMRKTLDELRRQQPRQRR